MKVQTLRRHGRWTKRQEEISARAAQHAFLKCGEGEAEINLVLGDDGLARALNKRFRGKDAPTNVLAFPAPTRMKRGGFLGEIVLAHRTIVSESQALHIPFEDRAAHLAAHGVLHLLGFTHESGQKAAEMEALERTILLRLGHRDPYPELGGRHDAGETS